MRLGSNGWIKSGQRVSAATYGHRQTGLPAGAGSVCILASDGHYPSKSLSVKVVIVIISQGGGPLPIGGHKMLRKIVNDMMPFSSVLILASVQMPASTRWEERLAVAPHKRRFGLDANNRAGQPAAPVGCPGMLLRVAKNSNMPTGSSDKSKNLRIRFSSAVAWLCGPGIGFGDNEPARSRTMRSILAALSGWVRSASLLFYASWRIASVCKQRRRALFLDVV